MTRRELLGAALMAGGADAGEPSLDALARRRGLRFGSALGGGAAAFGDERYRALVARECGLVVHENELKWRALRPGPGRFDFQRADAMLGWAEAQGLAVRGHTLLWQAPRWLPDWLHQPANAPRSAQEAERVLAEHIATVCTRYGTRIASWDVVNESVDPQTGALRDNVFTPHLGNLGQVELAFRLAREHAPHAQLVYNDYMGWGRSSAKHRAGVLALLQALVARGVPVQALGLQSHLGTGEDGRWLRRGGEQERDWRQFLDEVTALGLDLLITELDVNDRHLPPDPTERDAAVAAVAREYLDVTLSSPRLRSVMAWGLADHVSWMQTWWPRTDGLAKRSCLYDGQLRAKPLRAAIAAALHAAPARV